MKTEKSRCHASVLHYPRFYDFECLISGVWTLTCIESCTQLSISLQGDTENGCNDKQGPRWCECHYVALSTRYRRSFTLSGFLMETCEVRYEIWEGSSISDNAEMETVRLCPTSPPFIFHSIVAVDLNSPGACYQVVSECTLTTHFHYLPRSALGNILKAAIIWVCSSILRSTHEQQTLWLVELIFSSITRKHLRVMWYALCVMCRWSCNIYGLPFWYHL